MTIHDDIQAAVRGYMSKTSGGYPQAIVVSPEVLRQLTGCTTAIGQMRTAFLTDGGDPCEFIVYLGMWLLAITGARHFHLLDALPLSPGGRRLHTWNPPRGHPQRSG